MSYHKLREDKKCQNCGYLVRKRFCPKCGQENIETRRSFHYLFIHFIEDLVHYEGSFWKTLRNLLFRPGLLTVEYLTGKRKIHVAPVKLYIFVSFFVFFVGGIIVKIEDTYLEEPQNNIQQITEINPETTPTESRPTKLIDDYLEKQNNLPNAERDSYFKRKVLLEIANIVKNVDSDPEYGEKILDEFSKNLPTFLFFYMPVFAFLMWLFHNKKKWYFFDHGIFTLHYFSFLLLNFFVIISILGVIDDFPFLQNDYIIELVFGILYFITFVWMPIYFYKAHKKVFGFSKINTFVRTMFLFVLNFILLAIGIAIYLAIILYSL